MYLLTLNAAITLSHSFFWSEGTWEEGFEVDAGTLILLNLKEGEDYCEIGDFAPLVTPEQLKELQSLAAYLEIPFNIKISCKGVDLPTLMWGVYEVYYTRPWNNRVEVHYLDQRTERSFPLIGTNCSNKTIVWSAVIPGFCPAEFIA